MNTQKICILSPVISLLKPWPSQNSSATKKTISYISEIIAAFKTGAEGKFEGKSRLHGCKCATRAGATVAKAQRDFEGMSGRPVRERLRMTLQRRNYNVHFLNYSCSQNWSWEQIWRWRSRRRWVLKAGADNQVRDRLKIHLHRRNNLTILEILVII